MAAKIKVLSAGAVKPGMAKVIEAFGRETGHDVSVSFATAPAIMKRINGGATVDVVIAPENLLAEVAKSGKAAADRVTVGRIGVGVMVRDGAPLPKIATVEEFKRSLLGAESIVYNQASTGIYLENLFDLLAVAAPIKAKTTRYPDFAAVRDHVSKGSGNEIGFGATTVIIESASKGVKFAGALPAEIQNYTTYIAATIVDGVAGVVGEEFVRYLASVRAKALLTAAGIE